MEDCLNHGGKKRRAQSHGPLTYEQMEASIMHSMDTLGTKPEDYLAMIQRCLAKKAQQHMENGDVIQSEPDLKEEGIVLEDPNL